MSRKFIWIFVITLAVILFLTACERSAVLPQAQATATEQAGPGQTTVGLPDAYKTQTTSAAYTALALTMQPGAPVSTSGSPSPTVTHYWDLTVTPTSSIILPTTQNNPTVPTPTVGRPTTYTLQSGDFPYCIARRFNVDPDELMALNNLTDGMILQPGLVLNIPQTGKSFPGERALRPHPTTYTVQLDDTIYKVACLFGDVDPIYLAAYNAIPSPYTLTTGRVLNIP